MNEKQMKTIIGGIFGTGTYTVWDEDGQAHVKKEKFNIRLYKDLWHSGAIKKLKGNLLGIFLTIAIHADDQGEGWPTQQTIADLLGINRETVGKGLKKLEEYGFIEREKTRHKGKFDNTVYKIKFAPDLSDDTDQNQTKNKRKKSERPQKYHVGKTDTVENASNQHFHHVGKTDTEKPTRKNRHGKTDTKNDLISIKDDPSFKNEPSSSSNGLTRQLENPPSPKSNDSQYDDDLYYKTFRQEFISKGGDDIKLHKEHYPKFKQLLENYGFLQVLQMVDTYIKRYVETGKHDTPQVVWFLSDGWKSCVNNPRKQKRKINPIPAALSEQLVQAQKEVATTIEENDDDWNEINQQLAVWNQMKHRSNTSF